jgi:hypothetical protein
MNDVTSVGSVGWQLVRDVGAPTPYALAAERLCRAVEVAALLTICEGLFGGSDMGALNAVDKARRLYNDAMRESKRAPEARKEGV